MAQLHAKMRVATISPTPVGPVVDGSQYGKGARITLVPHEETDMNPQIEGTPSGELRIGVLNEKTAKGFQMGQVYNVALTLLDA